MRNMVTILGLAGFMIAVVVHALAWMDADLLSNAPVLWGLIVGVLILWLPAASWQRVIYGENAQNIMLIDMPDWMDVVVMLVWLYAFINALYSLAVVLWGPESVQDAAVLRCTTGAALFIYLTPALPIWYPNQKRKRGKRK